MNKTYNLRIDYKIMALAFIVFSTWWGLEVLSPPSPKTIDAPESEFSAERAFSHVETIASEPHPLGSDEHMPVMAYLISELDKLGLEPDLADGIGVSRGGLVSANTKNVLARLEGTESNHTILLLSHYDSVPYAPGAGDDASGVAAILETVRALTVSDRLKNDILILFTDGEELGLLGAEHFAETWPLLEEIDLVINLESRGSSGSSIMFETGSGNADLIPHYARATQNPFANSITYTVYKLLPNDTDFSVFKRKNIQGLNFAFIEDFLNYHTMLDHPDNLSLRSLQHHGENLLNNARYFGNLDFNTIPDSESDLVYFNNPFGGLTYYPAEWSLWIALITLALFMVTLYRHFKINRISPGKTLLAFLGILMVIAVSGAITHFGWKLVMKFYPEYQWLVQGETYERAWYFWGFLSIILLIFTGSFRWLSKKLESDNLMASVFLIWFGLMTGTAIYLPATSYLFIWPAFFALIAWLLTKSIIPGSYGIRTVLIWCTGVFMAFFLVPVYSKFIHIALTTNLLAGSMILIVLILAIAWPLIELITNRLEKWFYAFFILGFITCFVFAGAHSGYNSEKKKQNSLIYALDQDSGQAVWASLDHKTDNWTSQFLGNDPDKLSLQNFGVYGNRTLLQADAPLLEIEEPTVKVLNDSTIDSLRYLSIEIDPWEEANGVRLGFSNPGQINSADINGINIYRSGGETATLFPPLRRLYHYASMDMPLRLDLILNSADQKFDLNTVFLNPNLSVMLMNSYKERADYMMPRPNAFSNGMLLKKSFSFD